MGLQQYAILSILTFQVTRAVMLWNTGLVGNIQLPYMNESHDDTDDQCIGRLSSSPQDVIPMENEWLDEKLDLADHQLAFILLH